MDEVKEEDKHEPGDIVEDIEHYEGGIKPINVESDDEEDAERIILCKEGDEDTLTDEVMRMGKENGVLKKTIAEMRERESNNTDIMDLKEENKALMKRLKTLKHSVAESENTGVGPGDAVIMAELKEANERLNILDEENSTFKKQAEEA